MLKTILAAITLSFCILAVIGTGYSMEDKKHTQQVLPDSSCGDCHTCPTPTADAPCLRPCPRFSKTAVTGSPEEGPEVCILNQLSDMYVPVIFAHKLHAQMAEMGEGCETCHHHNPPGHIVPCRECHGAPFSPQNLRQPGLKGAYHRQCMNCHREWSHDTDCSVCHARKTAEAVVPQITDLTDIMGMLHPNVTEPDKRLYQTNYDRGPVVTFHHKEHIELYGLKCVDCHHEESCSRCHETTEKPRRVKSMEEHHKPCFTCHEGAKCSHCHARSEKPGFTHARTGWPLSQYHQSLDCRSCHPAGRKIGKLNRECIACHSSWTTETFNHAVTGLVLDETHQEMDCTDCHLERKFDQRPSCVNCHDDGRVYPQSSPGTITKGKKR